MGHTGLGRKTTYLMAIVATMTASLSPLSAQEVEPEGESAPPARQRPPIFSLPPGEVREQPQPDVQGPRGPGLPAPRLLGPDAEPPPSSPVFNTNSAPSQPPAETAPPVVTVAQPSTANTSTTTDQPSSRASAPPSESAPQATTETAPAIVADNVPAPAPVQNSADPVSASPEDAEASTWWMWLAGLLGLIGIAMIIRFQRGRQSGERRGAAQPAPLITPLPKAPAKPRPALAPVPAAPIAPPAADAPSRIHIDFQPMIARLSTLGLTLSYRLTMQNIGDEALTDLAIAIAIRSGDRAAMEGVAKAGPPCFTLDRLEPNSTELYAGEIRLDPQTFKPMQSEGRAMLIPIVDMFPRYRDENGVMHERHAAMLVGRELQPPRQKMQPFWLERGFGQFGALGCRMLGVQAG